MTSRPTTRPSAIERALTLTDGTATLTSDWYSWAGLQGGLLAALCLRAGVSSLHEDLLPRSLTAQFLEPAVEGGLELATSSVREGRSSAVVEVVAGSAARAVLVAGRSRGASSLSAVTAPEVPGPDDCPSLDLPVDLVPFSQHLRFRAATPARPLVGGNTAELVAWVRLLEDATLDAAALCVLVDAMPPALYGAMAQPVPIPTADLMVTFTGECAPSARASSWSLVRICTRHAAAGWCVDESDVWDTQGRLLASARQTRRVQGEWT